MSLTIDNLEKCFNKAKDFDFLVGVLIEMEGFQKPEVIINLPENIESKLEYYKNTYDENLNHKYAKGIKIVGFTYGVHFHDIEYDLLKK